LPSVRLGDGVSEGRLLIDKYPAALSMGFQCHPVARLVLSNEEATIGDARRAACLFFDVGGVHSSTQDDAIRDVDRKKNLHDVV